MKNPPIFVTLCGFLWMKTPSSAIFHDPMFGSQSRIFSKILIYLTNVVVEPRACHLVGFRWRDTKDLVPSHAKSACERQAFISSTKYSGNANWRKQRAKSARCFPIQEEVVRAQCWCIQIGCMQSLLYFEICALFLVAYIEYWFSVGRNVLFFLFWVYFLEILLGALRDFVSKSQTLKQVIETLCLSVSTILVLPGIFCQGPPKLLSRIRSFLTNSLNSSDWWFLNWNFHDWRTRRFSCFALFGTKFAYWTCFAIALQNLVWIWMGDHRLLAIARFM